MIGKLKFPARGEINQRTRSGLASTPSAARWPSRYPSFASGPWSRTFCLEWTVAVSDRQPPPDDHTFILRVVDAGFRLPTFMAAHRYLTRCLAENVVPGVEHLLGRPASLGRRPRSRCSFRRPPCRARPCTRLTRTNTAVSGWEAVRSEPLDRPFESLRANGGSA